ncbi:MAG: molybdopterin molybdotransferase MoeA [Methylococcales bacterium]|nr:molybdopterin molybdotransferase MoeA [Methylococcales bacterium]
MNTFKPAPSCTDINEYGSLRAHDALNLILERVEPVSGTEQIPLQHAGGRVLAQSIRSDFNVPAHTNSAVDGYAVRGRDLDSAGPGIEFRIIGTALAGEPFPGTVGPSECVRIMTGAVLSRGADTVLMQEHVEIGDRVIRIQGTHRSGDNVRPAGEDIRQGETILDPGRLCTPADIGLIASLGRGEVRAKRPIRVGLLSTGTEIRSIGTPLEEGTLYDSNRHILQAALQKLPVEISDYGIIPDDQVILNQTFANAERNNDIIISTGGVSVGDADHTRECIEALGQVVFSKVAIKPGRPLTFARLSSGFFFGLPGNPVAVMVTYYQFVLPALKKLAGIEPMPKVLTLRAQTLNRFRKKPGRTEYQRAILSRDENGSWLVASTGRQGSGILRSMSLANAFVILDHDESIVERGEEVTVQPFETLV